MTLTDRSMDRFCVSTHVGDVGAEMQMCADDTEISCLPPIFFMEEHAGNIGTA